MLYNTLPLLDLRPQTKMMTSCWRANSRRCSSREDTRRQIVSSAVSISPFGNRLRIISARRRNLSTLCVTYDSGLKELVKLGYLTPINDNENILLFHEAICAENPPKTDSLSEKQTEMIVEQICAENQNKMTTLEENPTTEATLSEIPTEWNIGGFYF